MKLGLAGCGIIAHEHARILQAMPEVTLAALADIRPERAEALKAQYGNEQTSVYGSFDEMLADESLEGIHLCTPHDLHVPMAVAALRAGKHVFMEKPPAVSPSQWELLGRAVAESPAKLGICFQNRYQESSRCVERWLAEGRIGELLGARAFVTWSRDAQYYQSSDWKGSWQREGGGALINQAIHTLDLLLRWMGRPSHVDAALQNFHLQGQIEVEDSLEAYLEFEGEPRRRAVFYATTAYPRDEAIMLELCGTEGRLRLEGQEVRLYDAQGKLAALECFSGKLGEKAYWGSGHPACIRDFYEALWENRAYANDYTSVDNTFRTMAAIYQAALRKEGKEWNR